MIRVLVSYSPEQAYEIGLTALLNEQRRVQAIAATGSRQLSIRFDAAVASDVDLARFKNRDVSTPTVVVASSPSPAVVRAAITLGAVGVLDRGLDISELVAVLGVVTSGCMAVVPTTTLSRLSVRLDEPPDELTDDAAEFLSLATYLTIEAAGAELGYSRRQAQRRFKAICESLSLRNHLHAAVMATRWGLDPQ